MALTASEQQTDSKYSEILKPKEKTFTDRFNDFLLKFSHVPFKEKMFFVQHLSVMFKAGIPLLAALRTLSKQSENKLFAHILKQVSVKIEQGTSLAGSLKLYPKVFNELFINMVESGEMSGKLEEVLGHLYLQMKKQHELVSRVKGALTYPIILMAAMIGIVFFMMVFIVPRITAVFSDYKAALPLPTRILIATSNFLSANLVLSLVAIAVLAFIFYRVLSTKKGKYFFQGAMLRFPIIGSIIKKINLARFSRTVSSLLKTDIMIIDAFRITAGVLANLHYRKIVLEISEKVKKGGQINEVINNYPKFFPPMVTQMIIIGEQTGEISSILEELASFYEEEIDQIMLNLPSIIEPLLILALGAGIGGIAVAVIMPMYSLTSSL
jgi:type IV pilus assembly protein PilC